MSEQNQMSEQEKAKLEVLEQLISTDMTDKGRLMIMEQLFEKLQPDNMVNFTDYANKKMEHVVSLKAEIAGRMLGKKAGELLDTTRKHASGLANKFSQEMKKFRGNKDQWSDVKNPYDENTPKS